MTIEELFQDVAADLHRLADAAEQIAAQQAQAAEFVRTVERISDALDRILLALRDR
jgi:ABC-type transporter Mla subunit MlaD